MRVVVIGIGIQGEKRKKIAGQDIYCTIDPLVKNADFNDIENVPVDEFDAALVCSPDGAKIEILRYLLENKKHVLVEKPLLSADENELQQLSTLACENRCVLYTAYNHRFEPHIETTKQIIASNRIGQVYAVRLFYGNGTARLVRDSTWRDQEAGVLPDLGSHLLDMIIYWFGRPDGKFVIQSANRFENKSFDHVVFGLNGSILFQLEVSLLSWRNHFAAEFIGEKGSIHIDSLCKWGPATLTVRDRNLPAGTPNAEISTLLQPDPTWQLEYEYFKNLVEKQSETKDFLGSTNTDIWINSILNDLKIQAFTGEA